MARLSISDEDIERIAKSELLGDFFSTACKDGSLTSSDKDFIVTHFALYLDDILSKDGVVDFLKDFRRGLLEHYVDEYRELSDFLFLESGVKEWDSVERR